VGRADLGVALLDLVKDLRELDLVIEQFATVDQLLLTDPGLVRMVQHQMHLQLLDRPAGGTDRDRDRDRDRDSTDGRAGAGAGMGISIVWQLQ